MQKVLRQNSDYILSIGLIGVIVPLIVFFIRQQFNIFAQIIFVIGFIFLGLYVALEYQRVLAVITGRQARYGGNALLMSVLFIGIVGMIAFSSQRYSKRVDLTATHSFSIAEQTGKVIDNLPRPVKIWGFFTPSDNQGDTETLLKAYVARGHGKITYEMIDPDARPTVARQYGVDVGESAVLVLESGDKRQKITGSAESDITSALLKISSDKQKVVYFLSGDGESTPDDTSQNGVAQAKQALEGDNYVVKSFSLITGAAITPTTGITTTAPITAPGTTGAPRQFGKIPSDASAIIIDAPKVPLADGEWQVVSDWVNNGGKLFLLMDALDGPSGLETMLTVTWGVQVRNDLVIDPSYSVMNDVATLVIQRGNFSPITKNLRAEVILPGARSISIPAQPVTGTTYTPLAQTSDQSWGETDLANLSNGVRLDANKDTVGPLDVGISVERDAPAGAKSRLVIFGNARFAADQWLQSGGGNLDLFVNSVNWLTEDEQLISIRPVAPSQVMLSIPPNDARVIGFGSVLGLPLLVLAVGAIVWWRRR